MSRTIAAASSFLSEFNAWLDVAFKAPIDLLVAAQAAIDGCGGSRMYPERLFPDSGEFVSTILPWTIIRL